jgi:hypothetical protein
MDEEKEVAHERDESPLETEAILPAVFSRHREEES